MDRSSRCVEVRRDDLRTNRIVTQPLPEPSAGTALLRIERFGLSSNNVSYAVMGDQIGYWRFFPAADGWGRVPAWGFAEVVASQVDGLDPGVRVYGFLPMAEHLVVEPARVAARGFTDGVAHRAELPAAYNRYQRTDADPLHSPGAEGLQAVLEPLFVTSFAIEDFLADNDDFGASRVVLSRASSKTAAGTALCLSRRSGRRPEVVGLTSAGHTDFVAALGCYDRVVPYEAVNSLDLAPQTVYVDIAGSASVRAAVHQHLGDQLRYSCVVGIAHWDAAGGSIGEPGSHESGLPGPTPTFFFAPAQIGKRVSEWGPAGYQQRLAAAWDALLEVARTWVEVVEVPGLDAVPEAFRQLVDGATAPDAAYVVELVDPDARAGS